MLLSSLLLIPLLGIFAILVNKDIQVSSINIKFIALSASILNLFLSIIIFILFDFSTNQFQFVQEYHEISYFNFYLGVDGLSIYFVLLTTIIIPISLLSNWTSISKDIQSYVIIILLLETLLLAVFLVLDILLFYIFFESILPPLFILIGIFGSDNRVKASFYLFLYTLLGSLFLLLSILAMSSTMSTTDFDTLFKGNFTYLTQLFLFYGIFIAFAVKTPTIFLNTWLLKAHVESPLGGSIILAAIVLKLSLYGILRLILPILPKSYMEYTYIIYLIGVITIVYASLSTLRTIDVKELIAYSSVSHAAVYLLAMFSNSIQGIEGSINLGLAHGLVSPALFICAGGILYDRSHSRLISNYRGVVQVMPLFGILFFIFCLANCGAPLSLNFVGEFMSLYGVFERSSILAVFASTSIIFSAGYTIYMYQRISFGGSYSKIFLENIPDLNKREFMILLTLVIPTVFFGIYTAPILDAIHYSVSTVIYNMDYTILCHSPDALPGSEEFRKMSECKETSWSLVKPTEFIKNMTPLCDFYKPGHSYNDELVYHEVHSSRLENYYKCSNCPAHICGECYKIATSNLPLAIIYKCNYNVIRKLSQFNTSKSHAFTSLPLQSSVGRFGVGVVFGITLLIIHFVEFIFDSQIVNTFIQCDAPRAWGLYFQDSASSQMEALVELHDNIMYYLCIMLFTVGLINKNNIKNFRYYFYLFIEFILTIILVFILLLISYPSFNLTYLMDEITNPISKSFKDQIFFLESTDFIVRAECASPKEIVDRFEGLETNIVTSNESQADKSVTFTNTFQDLGKFEQPDFSKLDGLLSELRSNINMFKDIQKSNLRLEIANNIKELELLGTEASRRFSEPYLNFCSVVYEMSNTPGWESTNIYIKKTIDLQQDLPKPTEELLQTNPVEYWVQKEKHANRVHNMIIHTLAIYKQMIKDNIFFNDEQKSVIFKTLGELRKASTSVNTQDKALFRQQVECSKILQQLEGK